MTETKEMQNKKPSIENLESWRRIIESKQSKIIIIKGKSGVGKSTLLRHLKKKYGDESMLVDSKSNIFDGTIEENIAIGRVLNVNLDKYLNIIFTENSKLQNKNSNISNQSLSAGQIQRIALIRDVIQSENKIVMLDEPTSALDKHSEKIVGNILENNFDEMGIKLLIVSTHSQYLEKCFKEVEIVYLYS